MEFNSADIQAFRDIWVFCEQREGKLSDTDFELISEGRKLADERGARLVGVVLGWNLGDEVRELGGYEADEGKHVKWGQIYRGIPTGLLTGAADRKLLDSLGLRLILDLRSESEAAEQPDYVPDGARLVRICGLCHPDGSALPQ